ncbi:MAG: N-acetylmuramoyl-L-alanine amidase family protein [Planktomarina sp.]
MIRFFWTVLVCAVCATAVSAQDLAGLSRATDVSWRADDTGGLQLKLNMTQAVPYAINALKAPNRIEMSFHTVSFESVPVIHLQNAPQIAAVRVIDKSSSHTILELQLIKPLRTDQVALRRKGQGVQLDLRFVPVTQAEFDRHVAVSPPTEHMPQSPVPRRNMGDRPWVIALDPGHGGEDPGADGGRMSEADLMLLFAFELRDGLRQAGFDVVLTRDTDEFVGLERRLTIARDMQADAFISLHADAVLEGVAHGVTVYTLDPTAKARANEAQAERHARHDIIGGVDLSGQGDEVSNILLDLARAETLPRSEKLAKAIMGGLEASGARMNSKPIRKDNYAVLRSGDIPAILIELGFLSSPADVQRLTDTKQRQIMVNGLVKGIEAWSISDAAEAALIRQ